jgi:cytochrome b561
MRLALLISVVGAASTLRDALPPGSNWPLIDLHAAFGMLLCLMVAMQFYEANLSAVPLSAAGFHALSRGLTRLVLLLLYVLFGLNSLVRIAALVWNSGVHGSAEAAIIQPPESLQDYLAYGVVALAIIHVLAAPMTQCSPTTSTTNELGISAGRGRG